MQKVDKTSTIKKTMQLNYKILNTFNRPIDGANVNKLFYDLNFRDST